MEKLKLHSPDLASENVERVAELFPNCVTESRDEDGNLKRAIDFDLLRQELSADLVEGPQERYRLDWPGKREALANANTPVAKTLRPSRKESVDFDTTEHLFIEGDNLEALKLLQETYLGKVKMIYIDPPYNTGNDFLYEDDFRTSREEFESESGERDEEGHRLIDEERWRQNSSANGRFHSDWLSMMYPRLKLARNLLREDGVFVASIDDSEVTNLRKVCDEVFGGQNFVACVVWARKRGKDNSAKYFSRNHEYLAIYAKSIRELETGRLDMPQTTRKAYKNVDGDKRGDFRLQGIWARGSQGGSEYAFTSTSGKHFSSRKWLVGKSTMESLDRDERLVFHGDKVYKKLFLSEYKGDIPETIWDDTSNAANAADEIKAIFGSQVFETVKPIPYIERILKIGSLKDSVVLDFFSGSATTAHAVMQLNAEDGGQRRHIQVQLPEPCDEKSEAAKAGYETIAEIGKERIRRAGAKIREDLEAKIAETEQGSEEHATLLDRLKRLDTGFRVLKIDSSNMADVHYRPDQVAQDDLGMQVENIKPDRTPEDLLFQVLLDWGVDLALPIEREEIAGKTVFSVDGNALAACFDTDVDDDFVKALAEREPLRAVFRDASFADDAARINVEQIFHALSPHTEVRAI